MKTLEDWHVELANLRSLSVKNGLGLHSDHVDIADLKDGSVGQIGHETVSVIEAQDALKIGDEYTGPCIVYSKDPGVHIPLRAAGYLIPSQSLPVMIVNLAASDSHIIDEVKHVLRKRRGPKALLRTTGPYSLSRSLRDEHITQKWRKYHIIELAELLAWRGSDPPRKRQYPNHVLGGWIDEHDMTEQKTSEAIVVLKQAIDALPYVLAEVQKIELGRQSE